MSELEEIQRKADELKLEFLLIGGLAVIQHGYARVTTDIDFVVRAREKQAWRDALEGLGYKFANDGVNFHQYDQPPAGVWPLDLMLVNDSTFDKLSATAVPACIMGANLRLVSVKHLLALKLHVLKQSKPNRLLDDLNDVVELIKVRRLDLNSSEYRDLFIQYGNADLYERIRRLSESG